MAALTKHAASGAVMVKGFGPLMPGFRQLPCGDMEALKAISGPQLPPSCQPVQGEAASARCPTPTCG